MQWLCAHSQNKQENFASEAQRVKLISKQHEHNISILQDQQLKDKIQTKESSSRRKIEKKLQCVAEKEVELSNEFPHICKR